jgi:hypothetical protein
MKLRSHLLSMTSLLVLAACGGMGNTPITDAALSAKASLATAPAGDLTVELLTDTQLETGLTPVYLKITTAAGLPVTDAAVTFMPMMAMSNGMNHTCPMLGMPAVGSDGLYRVDVVFLMASGAMDIWSATVTITQPGSGAVAASFPQLTVIESGRLQAFAYTDPVTTVATKYFTSLNFVNPPKIGLNPIVFTVHFRQDMMTFPSVDDAEIALDPEMPAMGHGSPGSVNPSLSAPGRYEGQLSFSMAGQWQTAVTIVRGGVTVGAPMFATTF